MFRTVSATPDSPHSSLPSRSGEKALSAGWAVQFQFDPVGLGGAVLPRGTRRGVASS
jgi:hypothetical protein